MIEFLCGLPGKGKGVLATRRALAYHKSKKAKITLKEVNKRLSNDNQVFPFCF